MLSLTQPDSRQSLEIGYRLIGAGGYSLCSVQAWPTYPRSGWGGHSICFETIGVDVVAKKLLEEVAAVVNGFMRAGLVTRSNFVKSEASMRSAEPTSRQRWIRAPEPPSTR